MGVGIGIIMRMGRQEVKRDTNRVAPERAEAALDEETVLSKSI